MTPRHEDDEAGFSVKEGSGRPGGKGTYASFHGAEKVVENTAQIAKFREQNSTNLSRRGRYLGGWNYDDQRYLDVSRRFIGGGRVDRARDFGRRNAQIGLYDTEHGELPTFQPKGGGLGKGKEGMKYSEHMAGAARSQLAGRQAGSMEEVRAHASELADQVWEAQQIKERHR